jgi:MFS family permease
MSVNMPEQNQNTQIHKFFLPVYIIHFINFFNLMMWIPITEPVLRSLGVTNDQTLYVLNGLLIAIYPICQFLVIQPLNSLSEYFGRQRILQVTQLGTLLSLVITIISLSYTPLKSIAILGLPLAVIILLIARAIDGASGGNVMITTNYANDLIEEYKIKKTQAFQFVELAMMSGSLAGVILAPVFEKSKRFGPVGMIYLILTLSIISLIVAHFKIKNPKSQLKTDQKLDLTDDLNIWHHLQFIKSNAAAKSILLYRFVFHFIFIGFVSTVFIVLNDVLKINQEGSNESSIIMAGVILVTIIIQIFVCNPIISKLGDLKAVQLAKISMMISLFLFSIFFFIPDKDIASILLFLAFALLSVGVNISLILFKPIITSSVEQAQSSKILAIEEQLMIIAAAVAPIFAGLSLALFRNFNLPLQIIFTIFGFISFIYYLYDQKYQRLIKP